MLLFTWNLHRSERALRLALTHLERRASEDLVVACFQEVPPKAERGKDWSTSWDQLRRELPSQGLRLVQPVVEAGRIAMVCSTGLRVSFARPDRSKRMLIARFRTPIGSELVVVGCHAFDRINFGEAEQRGGLQALARRELDEVGSVTLFPLVLLGDFNASPGDTEVADRSCFYVLGPGDHHNGRSARHYGRESPPLYVASPKLMAGPGTGSIFVEWGGRSRWEMYDFIATTGDLRGRISTRILAELGGVLLLRPRKPTPNGDTFSDHLPVEAELEFR